MAERVKVGTITERAQFIYIRDGQFIISPRINNSLHIVRDEQEFIQFIFNDQSTMEFPIDEEVDIIS